jgi:enoyl-CoA hydratase/carnithine racemase
MTLAHTDASLPALTRDGDVFVLHLGSTENGLNPTWLDAVEAALATVAAEAPVALVTAAEGKSWSNGLDLPWLMAHPEQIEAFTLRVHTLFATVLELGVPTVAALQGHAFGAGAMLALAHDHRVIRADRGYFCFPEVDIKIPFTDGMTALITAKLPTTTANTAMTTGRRYGGAEAVAVGIADHAVAENEVLPTAVALAQQLAGKAGPTLAAIKQGLYRPALTALRPR